MNPGVRNAREPWLTPPRGRLLFGIFLCLFGLFGMSGAIYQYVIAERRTEHREAIILKVTDAPPRLLSRIFPPFTIEYKFTVENDVIKASGNYDVAPASETMTVEYEPAKPENNALVLPSREKGAIAAITLALIVAGGWLILRNAGTRYGQAWQRVHRPRR